MDGKAFVVDEWRIEKQDERVWTKETKSRRRERENCEKTIGLITQTETINWWCNVKVRWKIVCPRETTTLIRLSYLITITLLHKAIFKCEQRKAATK